MVVLTQKHLAHVAHVAPMLRVGWATWVGCFPLSLSYYARELAQAPLPLGSHAVELVFALTAHPSARPCRVKLELHIRQFLSAYSAFHNQFPTSKVSILIELYHFSFSTTIYANYTN